MIEVRQQSLTEDLKKQIYEGFSRHAISMTGHDEKFDPVAFIAEVQGCFAGALVVELFWGALHVKYIYVEDRYRGKGVGSQLMEYALKYGRDKACHFAFVETMSFQALDFYRKLVLLNKSF